jgi:formate C-acetyltransferase
LIYTKIYRDNEDKPPIVKRALALNETLKKMSVFIDEDELIVGNHSSQLRAAPVFPEYAMTWLLEEIDELNSRPGDAFFISEKTKIEIREIGDFWKGRTLIEKGYESMSDLIREIHDSGIIRAEGNLTSGDGHIAVNFERILNLGLKGYRELVKKKRKDHFYRAVEIGLDGIETFIARFADLSSALSGIEKNPERKVELERICAICNKIKIDPPQNFYEALQLVYFIQLILQIESNGHSVSLGRMDQYLYSFYKSDLEDRRMTPEFAAELLKNTWLKLFSINKIRPWSHTRYSAGSPLYQNVTIGGQTEDGEDAVNDLSYLILGSVGEMKLTQPNLTVRYHKNIDDDFMNMCIKVIEKGFGMPAFNNDEIVIPSLMSIGVEKEDAFNYSAIGCIEVAVPGKWGYRCTGMSFLNLMRVFLAALHDGRDVTSGKTFFKGTGKFEDFTSFDDVLRAWEHQIRFYAKATVSTDTVADKVLEKYVPDIICSAFVDDCIDRGKTLKEGGAKYDYISGLQVGIANLGNSLAAIKKLVFEEEKIGKKELMEAMKNNFEGHRGEKIRQLLLNQAPKYGNDDDYVDKLLYESYMYFIKELEKYHNTRYMRGPLGGGYFAGTSSISANVPSGASVPATPDGRKAFTPLAEGCSPSAGTDLKGPTAVFKSVSKLPTEKIIGGVLLNQKLSPHAIKTDNDKSKLIHLIRTFFDRLKGWHVQYNIVSKETLVAAQKKPEKHRDLVVRVAGYSAFFTTLSPETQDDIIARTEHTIMRS